MTPLARPVRITDGGMRAGEVMVFGADDDSGPLVVIAPAAAWETLLNAFDWPDEDRRELALFELEQACAGRDRGSREIMLDGAIIESIAEQRAARPAVH